MQALFYAIPLVEVPARMDQCSRSRTEECRCLSSDANMSKESNWTALPDLILILLPTALLMISGSNDGKSRSQYALTSVEKLFVDSFACGCDVIQPRTRGYGWRRAHTLILVGSLVYSSVFPFTVSIGESRGYHYVLTVYGVQLYIGLHDYVDLMFQPDTLQYGSVDNTRYIDQR